MGTNYLLWDGRSEVSRQEFDLETDVATGGVSFMQLNKRFYAYTSFSSTDKFFRFWVLIGEEKEIADQYLATIEVYNKVKQISTSITFPVLPLEEFQEST